MQTVSLLVTCALGVLGWSMAWMTQRARRGDRELLIATLKRAKSPEEALSLIRLQLDVARENEQNLDDTKQDGV